MIEGWALDSDYKGLDDSLHLFESQFLHLSENGGL